MQIHIFFFLFICFIAPSFLDATSLFPCRSILDCQRQTEDPQAKKLQRYFINWGCKRFEDCPQKMKNKKIKVQEKRLVINDFATSSMNLKNWTPIIGLAEDFEEAQFLCNLIGSRLPTLKEVLNIAQRLGAKGIVEKNVCGYQNAKHLEEKNFQNDSQYQEVILCQDNPLQIQPVDIYSDSSKSHDKIIQTLYYEHTGYLNKKREICLDTPSWFLQSRFWTSGSRADPEGNRYFIDSISGKLKISYEFSDLELYPAIPVICIDTNQKINKVSLKKRNTVQNG